MTTDRFDSLLARALATGTIPPEATAAERAELEPLLRTGAILEQAGAETAREASTSMPIARARFERFLVAESQNAGLRGAAARPPRRGILGRLVHSHRGLLLAGGAVAVGLVAVIAVFGTQSLFSGTETADAQVLVPDDFVQVQGVAGSVSLVDGVRTVTLQSEFGNVSVLLSADTSVVRDQTNATSDSIKPGDSLLVGGVVGAGVTGARGGIAWGGVARVVGVAGTVGSAVGDVGVGGAVGAVGAGTGGIAAGGVVGTGGVACAETRQGTRAARPSVSRLKRMATR